MNAPDTVSAALRERIRSAMAGLAFVADQSARSLSSRHSRLIGVLAPTLDEPGWAACIEAMEVRLAAAGHSVLLALTGGDPRREEAAVVAMVGRAVEAVVAVGRVPGDSAREQLRARRVPVTHVDADVDAGDATGTDAGGGWRRAGSALGHYLVGLGHARCAWVTGQGAAMARAAAVRAGLTDALAAATLPAPADVICRAGTPRRAELVRAAPAATALVCADDALALAVLRELAAAGIGVPRDVSVTGCGDAPAARHATPPLTTLRRPYEAVGAATADRVLAGLRGDPVLPEAPWAKLVVRRSTGPAR